MGPVQNTYVHFVLMKIKENIYGLPDNDFNFMFTYNEEKC